VSAWIQTYSGVAFDLVNPTAEMVHIVDIAHSLAHLCRFGGHTREFYSVAQHSVIVSRNVPQEMRLAALLHDAPEAYCGDVTRPLKGLRGMSAYRSIERGIWRAVAERFGLPEELPDAVKAADDRALFAERRDLMGECDREWEFAGEPLVEKITAWHPQSAERLFLRECDVLQRARGLPRTDVDRSADRSSVVDGLARDE
jgi:hypothetical protein